MKKFLFIALMAFFSLNAHAQLKVTEEVKDAEKISSYGMSIQPAYSTLKRTEAGLYYLTINSSNRFDDTFKFYLGMSDEAALQTLLDLESLYNKKKTTIIVKNGNKECQIRGGKLYLYFYQSGYAGDLMLYKDAIKKFILDIGKK